MAYDEGLAERIGELLDGRRGLSETKMFGGIAFLLHGNMCVGIVRSDLMVRVGPAAYEAALARPHAREMKFTGRAMNGFVFVSPEGYESDEDLRGWVEQGTVFAESLPPKKE